jgi:hypothetical protein
MADYIDRQILCQAYVHVEPSHFSAKDAETLRETIKEFIQKRGEFFIGSGIETEIVFEDGSLKIKASIYAKVTIAITNAIVLYGGFRAGIDYLAADGKGLSEATVLECLFQTQCHHNETIHTEARIGVIGQIKRVNNSIDRIRHDLPSVDTELSAKRIDRLAEEIRRLRSNIKDQQDIDFVSEKIMAEVDALLPKKAPKNFLSKESIRRYELSRQNIADALQGL